MKLIIKILRRISMDIAAALVATFILLVTSVFKGIYLGYPLGLAIILFSAAAARRGHRVDDIIRMAYRGGRKSFIVVKVFVLIGALIPLWMSAGTVPAIVYYGIEMIRPNLFILSAFLISCAVSLLIGTAVGTTGVVGAALMVMARSGGVDLYAAAGAIIAGAYFGDRCSPVSSGASFIASITDTDLYDNVSNMFRTSVVPLIISSAFYLLVSRGNPLGSETGSISSMIADEFDLNLVVLVPAAIIIGFSLMRINVKTLMGASIAAALAISIFIQKETLQSSFKYMIFGFTLDDANVLYGIIKGGGILPMMKTALVVYLASSFAGILEGANLLCGVEKVTSGADTRYKVFKYELMLSFFTAAVGCSQTFAVMMTKMLNSRSYEKNGLDRSCEAIDLENTAIMVSPMIPWNIALLAPMTILGTNAASMPYMIYIYLVPLWNLVYLKLQEKQNRWYIPQVHVK
ncbi:MAG: Na+/H+ antiporter NhaC family protein [Sedimentibacter sp.]|uniref:Na+/H+ antiporter NhaC family protein n=1 Tax=Sedimentibacter sp. TaxID=1960295 RepID=UPI0031588210